MTAHQLLRLKQVEEKNWPETLSDLPVYEKWNLSTFNKNWPGQCSLARIGN